MARIINVCMLLMCWALMLCAEVKGGLTSVQQKAILDIHNQLRRKEGASNMEVLKYNANLAQLAQTWSNRCEFKHGNPPFTKASAGFDGLGQNLFATTNPSFKVEDAVNSWYSEKKDYNYNSNSCTSGKACGHYTQVVWAKTTDLGCGVTLCPKLGGMTNAYYVVCNYGPPGNFNGEKPFLKGLPCTQCNSGKFYCNQDLCDQSCNAASANCQCKASCRNGGKTTSGCRCQCAAGSTGTDCGLPCADRDPKCGANPGYPQFTCTLTDPAWAFVKETCPKLCKICQPLPRKRRSLLEAFQTM